MSRVKVLGIDNLYGKLSKIADIDLKQPLTEACLIVENEAKERCPVDIGTLRSSITHEVEDNQGFVGTNLEYAPYVEFGTGLFASKGDGRQKPWTYQDAKGNWHTTVGQHPQPFLQPALDNNRDEVNKIINNGISKELKKYVKR